MIISRVPKNASAWGRLIVPMVALLLWDVVITLAYYVSFTHFDGISIQYSLYGTAIALFLGFMVNAAYSRWWEARTLWGAIVNNSRSLAREAVSLMGTDGVARQIVQTQIAYVHALRTSLRDQEVADEVFRYLTPGARQHVLGATNLPNALLTDIGRITADAMRDGAISDINRMQLETTLTALSDAQGGLERIKRTPLPVQYRFLPEFFARAFCVILPFAVVQDLGWLTPIGSGLVGLMFLLAVQVGHDLAEPFSDTVNDVPMTAICRTIEIDLLESIGGATPQKVEPVDDVLW